MDSFFQFVFSKVQEVKYDYEVKRYVLGLTSLLVNSEMPDSVKNQYPNIIKALAFLSGKSIEIRQKALEGKQKAEEAEVEDHGEAVICEDEEDTIIDIDSDEDDDAYEYGDDGDDIDGDDNLYDSPLDDLDEVLHLQTQLNNLQQAGGQELFNYLMQQLSPEEQQSFQLSVQAAQDFQQQQQQQEQGEQPSTN